MVYEPRDDSFLFLEVLENMEPMPEKILEIGSGSGILSKALLKKGADILSSDIDPEAYGTESDLFENIEGKFDLIFWNMPYLPGKGDRDLHCGEGEVLIRFFREAKKHLKPGGFILFLISDKTPLSTEDVERIGYEISEVKKKKIFFEELKVLKAVLR